MIMLSRQILAGYRLALNLYPAEFREHNRAEMLHCASEMIAQSTCLAKTTWALTYDLARSLSLEYLAMSIARIPQLAILMTLTTFVAAIAYLVPQQVLRMSANDPQMQLAEDAASRLSSGEPAAQVVPERPIDMASSLAPFVIVYNDSGRPVASSANLDGTVPAPPRGVFEVARVNHEHSVTWQPRSGVRIASVITRTRNGFVVAGRNMREVENREATVFKLDAVGWLCANTVLLFLWFVTPLFGNSNQHSLQTV